MRNASEIVTTSPLFNFQIIKIINSFKNHFYQDMVDYFFLILRHVLHSY
jgi:hypothetical protein